MIIKSLSFLFLVFTFVLFSLNEYFLASILSVFLICAFTWNRRENTLQFFVFLYLAYVSIKGLDHFYDYYISYHDSFLSDRLVSKTLMILALFATSFFISTNKNNVFTKPFIRTNMSSFILLLSIAFLILIIGIQGPSFIQSGNPFSAVKLPVYEYFPGVIFLAYLFHNPKKKIHSYLINFLIILYVLKSLYYFSRIEIIQIGFLLIIIHGLFEKKLKIRHTLPLIVIIIFVNTIYSKVRENPIMFLNQGIKLENIFERESKLQMSHGGDIVQASARILGLIETGKLNESQRILGLPKFFLNSIYLFSNDTTVHLSLYDKDRFTSGGGALMPIYFYTWAGYIGVVLSGFFLGLILHPKKEIVKVYSGILIISIFRILGYSPINLVKYSIFMVILYLGSLSIIKLNDTIKRRKYN